jgi:hypothetical protein
MRISIGSQLDAKGFKQAETALNRLSNTSKNLAKSLVVAFSANQITQFGKKSVLAFTQDQKAAAALGQTLKNLNLSYGSSIGTINGFISRLEAQTGVLDDQLRPAMDRLLRATGSVTKAQDLLALSLDISAGTGKSLTQVSQSIQKAYLGQTQALGRLGVGLSKSELASGSFEEIQKRLTVLFAGQAQVAAQGYAGELDKLSVAANNAKEAIGKGLVDALIKASGGTGTGNAIEGINKLSTGVADVLTNVGDLIGKLHELKPVLIGVGVVAAAYFLPVTTAIATILFGMSQLDKMLNKSLFKQGIIPGGFGNVGMTVQSQDTQKSDKLAASAAKKREDAATKAAAALLAAQKKQTASQIAAAKLARASAIFDMKQIQITAALKGKLNEADRLTLEIMLKIEQGKADEALALEKKLKDTQKYIDLLSVMADKEVTPEEVAILAKKWDMSAGAVLLYITAVTGVNNTAIDSKAVTALMTEWGLTKSAATKYLDYFAALNDGKLSTAEQEALMKKWGDTKASSEKYLDFYNDINDGKLTDTEITNLSKKWGMSKDEIGKYLLQFPILNTLEIDDSQIVKIITKWADATGKLKDYNKLLTDGTTFSESFSAPGLAASDSWKAALQAFNDYQNGTKVLPPNTGDYTQIPQYPQLPPVGGGGGGGGGGMNVQNVINVTGAIDPIGVANQISQVLQDAAGNTSNYVNLGTGAKGGGYSV